MRFIHKRPGRARLRQPELRRDKAPALAPSQSNRTALKIVPAAKQENYARRDPCGGCPVMGIPTAIKSLTGKE